MASIIMICAHSESVGMGAGVGGANGMAAALAAEVEVPPVSEADTVQV